MSSKHSNVSVDPIQAILFHELSRAFEKMAEVLAEHLAKKIRRDFQFSARPSDPLRQIRKELESVGSFITDSSKVHAQNPAPVTTQAPDPKFVTRPTLSRPTIITGDPSRLRQVRKEAGLSQIKLASLTGVCQTDISAMELGRKKIPSKLWDFIELQERSASA